MWTDFTLGWLFVAVVSGEDGDGTQTGLPRTDTVAKQAQLRARWALSRANPRLSCDDRLNGYVDRSELTEGEFVVGTWADSHKGDDAARRGSLHRRPQRLQAGVAQVAETPALRGPRGPCGYTLHGGTSVSRGPVGAPESHSDRCARLHLLDHSRATSALSRPRRATVDPRRRAGRPGRWHKEQHAG